MLRHVRLLNLLVPFSLACLPVVAAPVALSNAGFEEGGALPTGWTLSGGDGAWTQEGEGGGRGIEVSGIGDTANYWRTGALGLCSNAVYQLRFSVRRSRGGASGCATTGPVFANRDVGSLGKDWRRCTSIFVTPDALTPEVDWLRFGQWQVNGTVAYDNIDLVRVEPIHRQTNNLVLGDGESVTGKTYRFTAPLGDRNGNYCRPLLRHQCAFNSNRWVFDSPAREVVYRQEAGSILQTRATVEVNMVYHAGGTLYVFAGVPGGAEVLLGTMTAEGPATFEVPERLLPARVIDIRLAASGTARQDGPNLAEGAAAAQPGAFQVGGYTYEATLAEAPGDNDGTTIYVAERVPDGRVDVKVLGFGDMRPGGVNVFRASLRNDSSKTVSVTPTLRYVHRDGPEESRREHVYAASPLALAPGEARPVSLAFPLTITGDMAIRLSLGEDSPYTAEAWLNIPAYYAIDYGERLPDSSDRAGLWWASSGWKVWPERPLPALEGAAMRIALARNESEAAQFVLRPQRPLKGLSATPGVFKRGGDALPGGCVEVLRVRYVDITQPTDETGVRGAWPDPLPPFTAPINLDGGRNHPFWVRVRVPEGTRPGLYRGAIRLKAQAYTAEVPLHIEVYGFTLPKRMTCVTSFGISPQRIFQYQGLTDSGQQRAVWEKYLETLAAHHIFPYDPAPLDPFRVTWPDAGPWEGGVRDRTVKHSGQASARIEDTSKSASHGLNCARRIPLPEGGLRLAFWYRTGTAGHAFNATVRYFRADGRWLSGKNADLVVEGSPDWRRFEHSLTTYPENATHGAVTLWGARWTDGGEETGTVWCDDLEVSALADGRVLLREGFEPLPAESLTPKIDWTAWDRAMTHAVDDLGCNAFKIPMVGLGGGTFHDRVEPSLLGYREGTPEYTTAFTAYAQAVEAHLAARGWLDEAYVYWFDEPDPKDYAFVMNGFEKLRRAAPGLRGMLTEQVEAELVGGPKIWCPLTPAYDPELAALRREKGDEFWWYICTGPKAPYVTLFIDHPGTELRVWGWQTFKRGITGMLVWQTNYWTSPTAYTDPEHPQNPYEDPMSWTTGYGVPAGTRAPWGNGDGRFLYPPEAAAHGRPGRPVLEGPVVSIRLEMLRDGIEDYEYLALLTRLLAKHRDKLSAGTVSDIQALLRVPGTISRNLTQFTRDPAPMENRREALARAIASLSRIR